MELKKAAESLVVMTEIVLPNDTNTFGNLMGGRLMYWMVLRIVRVEPKEELL